jgi:hypothetical protein
MKHARLAAMAAFVAAASVPAVARAQLGNLTYTSQELFHEVALFNAANMPNGPSGSNTVLMIHGLLLVMGSNDSGKPPGTFHVFDVRDPHKPVLLKTYNSPATAQLRELHAMPMAVIDGKFVLVCPTTKGVQFFDFTDPMNPQDLGALALNGVSGGDYTNVAWELSWSWPWLFVGSSGSGFDVVDATDPTKPMFVKQVPTGQLGNFRVGPVHAAGNYLTVASMDQPANGVSVMDVSDPRAPFLLVTSTNTTMYSSLTIGDLIFGVGEGANYTFLKWSPDAITKVGQKKIGSDKGGYCTYQDGYGFCGQSKDGFHKLDLRQYDINSIKEVGNGKPMGAEAAGGDFDFATVIGNLVYLGNDHGTGASFIPHQMEPDKTPPQVFKVYPVDNAVKQPLSTRVTIFFTDEIDLDSAVSSGNVIVRKAGGAPLAGVISHSSFNAISFGPKQPLEANSTYEVVVKAGGVKDHAGNVIVGETISRFSTGQTIVVVDGGSSGTGGAPDAGNGGGGAGGSSGSTATGGGGGSSGDTTGGSTVSTGMTTTGPSGTTSGAGGDVGAGGSGEMGGASGKGPSGDVGSCHCAVPGREATGTLSLLALALGVGGAWIRRRRKDV